MFKVHNLYTTVNSFNVKTLPLTFPVLVGICSQMSMYRPWD